MMNIYWTGVSMKPIGITEVELLGEIVNKPHYGSDECGRGCLNGDVVVASVLLGEVYPDKLNDSKKLTEKQRNVLFDQIIESAIDYKIVRIPPSYIDTHNILKASLNGMKESYLGTEQHCNLLLVDGNKAPDIPGVDVVPVIKGDGRVPAISAASILAKVTRDRDMLALHEKYPKMEYHKHKGYPTALHKQRLLENGLNETYRMTYKPVIEILDVINGRLQPEQKSLF